MRKTIFVTIALLLLAASMNAGSVSFGTGLGLEGNTFNGVNVATATDPVWHAPFKGTVWESIQPNTVNPQVPNGTVVDFWFLFTVSGTPTSGDLSVLVDDSAEGYLNGVELFDNLGSPQGVNCSASLPNCLLPLNVDIAGALIPGLNRLDILVSQDGLGPFGLDVFGRATSASISESGTGVLLLIACAGVFLWRFCRARGGRAGALAVPWGRMWG